MPKVAPNILVVDDVKDWRLTLRGLLQDEGYQVKDAESSQKALSLLAKEGFDLAVIDIRLDETNEDDTEGITLAKNIRNQWPQTQIIIITGYETPATLEEAMKPGPGGDRLVRNYILKKDTKKDLIPEVQKAIGIVLASYSGLGSQHDDRPNPGG